MTTAEVYEYWLPAFHKVVEDGLTMGDVLWESQYDFECFLGVDYWSVWQRTPKQHDQPLDPDFANFLKMLVESPHSKTILWAYRIRKGLIK